MTRRVKDCRFLIYGDPYGSRTRVAAVKGQCPRPLDEGVVSYEGRIIPVFDYLSINKR